MIAFYKNFSFKNYLITGLLVIAGSLFTQNTYAQITNVTLTPKNPQCAEYDNGSILVNVTGGTAPYTYLWSDGNTSGPTRSNLKQGSFSVIVTDNNGNGLPFPSQSISLVDPPKMQAIGAGNGIIDVDCFGKSTGSIEISILNAVGTITYKWTKNGVSTGGNLPKLTDLSAGTYSLLATDSRGCFTTPTFPISQPTEIKITETTHTNNIDFGLANGVIILNVTGAVSSANPNPTFTYLWNDGNRDKDRSGLLSGKYTVTVTDNKGCEKELKTDILPLFPFVVTGSFNNNKCFKTPNGSITITSKDGVPPYKYKWSDQTDFVTNPNRTFLSANTYILTAQDANGLGAVRTLPFTITEPSELLLDVTKTNKKCFLDNLGTITLNVLGGIAPYRYVLNGVTSAPLAGSTFTIPNLASGSYTVSIIDAENCATTPPQSVDILPLTKLEFTTVIPNKIQCGLANSGRIDAVVRGGYGDYVYEWSNASGIIPNETRSILLGVTKGIYKLKVTDKLGTGCFIEETREIIEEFSPLIVREIVLNHINNDCYKNQFGVINKNGKVTIEVLRGSGNYEYKFQLNNVDVNITTVATATPGRVDVPNLQSGSYKLFVKDLSNGCPADMFTFAITPIDSIGFGAIVKNESCVGGNNGSIELKPTGVILPSFRWVDAPLLTDSIRRDLRPGNYIAIIDDNRCSVRDTFTILPAIPLTQVDSAIIIKSNTCTGGLPNGSIKITVEGGEPPYTYKWDFADPATGIIVPDALDIALRKPNQPIDEDLRDGLASGNYVVTVTDKNLCETKLPALDPLKPKFKTYNVEAVSCDAANLNLTPDPLMSPNGDGQGNEFFKIEGIEKFPDNEVVIYNRWGMEVFTKKRYNNSSRFFTGVANSALTNTETVLIDGVYYYTIRTILDKKPRVNKGFIIIKR